MYFPRTRFLLTALVLGIVMVGVATTSESHTAKLVKVTKGQEIKQTCVQGFKINDYLAYAPGVYRRDKVSIKAHSRLAKMHLCQRSYKARFAVSKIHDRLKDNRVSRQRAAREAKLVSRYTPFEGPNGTRWAIPWAIVACESRGDFRAYNGILGAGGAYQIIPSTWAAYGGRQFASVANLSSELGQHITASKIWAGGSGRGQWAC